MLKRIARRVRSLSLMLAENSRYRKLSNYHIGDKFRRIYLYHIQKTGGTSLNHMFLSLGNEDPTEVYGRLGGKDVIVRRTISNDKIFVGWNKRLIEGGRYFYAFSHIPMHQIKLPDKTFTITCLRNPTRRVLSLYKEFFEYKVNNVDHPCRIYSDKWLGSSFSDFLKNIPRSELLNQLYMFSSHYDIEEAIEGILSCSFFFRTEQFKIGCAECSKKLNIDLQPVHMRKTSAKVDISEAELKLLDLKLEPEYRLLAKLEKHMRRR